MLRRGVRTQATDFSGVIPRRPSPDNSDLSGAGPFHFREGPSPKTIMSRTLVTPPQHQQLELSLIPHTIDNSLIMQRAVDGFVNATAMCQAVGKEFAAYTRLNSTQAFLNELCADMGIHMSEIVITIRGGPPRQQGTWVHPDVAINLGQWCSPRFAVAVSRWVRDWLNGKAKPGLPYHIRRYVANASQVPATHFSILNEMIFGIIAPLETRGFTVPENMMPDISEGKMFCKWLRDAKGIDTNSLPTYRHSFEDGRVVNPKLYPIDVLPDFRRHLNEAWIPMASRRYFGERAPEALPFLDAVILALPAPQR